MMKALYILILLGFCLPLMAQGAFDIDKFTDPAKYGWTNWEDRMNYRYDLFERQKLLQIYEINAQSTVGNVLKSSVFPGWGQFNTKQYTKGEIFMAMEIGLLGASYLFYDKAMSNYDKYKTATQIDEINAYYHDALVPYRYSQVFLTLAAVLWAYNIFDVVQTTDKYNADIWQKALKSYYNSPVQVSPEGIQIRF